LIIINEDKVKTPNKTKKNNITFSNKDAFIFFIIWLVSLNFHLTRKNKIFINL